MLWDPKHAYSVICYVKYYVYDNWHNTLLRPYMSVETATQIWAVLWILLVWYADVASIYGHSHMKSC